MSIEDDFGELIDQIRPETFRTNRFKSPESQAAVRDAFKLSTEKARKKAQISSVLGYDPKRADRGLRRF